MHHLNDAEPTTKSNNGNATEFFRPGSGPGGLHLLRQGWMALGEFIGSFGEADDDAINRTGEEAHHDAAEDEADDESDTVILIFDREEGQRGKNEVRNKNAP